MRIWQIAALMGLLAACKPAGMGNNNMPPDMAMVPAPAGSQLLLSTALTGLQAGSFVTLLNFYDLGEMGVRVIAPSIPSPTVLHLKFLNPRGGLVYEDDTAWSMSPGGTMGMTDPPMQIKTALPVAGGVQMDRGIQVAGTSFSKYFEEGDWQVQATLDGVPGTITTPFQAVLSR